MFPQFFLATVEVATMYNSFVNTARQSSLARDGRIDERVLAVYDANCALFRVANDTDNCKAITVADVCNRTMNFNPSLATAQLLNLCASRSGNTGTFFTFANEEICKFVTEEDCSNSTEVFSSGSFADIFCSDVNKTNDLMDSIKGKCSVIDGYNACKEREYSVYALQCVVIVGTMVLYAVLDVWYGRLDGDAGEVEIKRLFAKAALDKKPIWISKWQAIYTASVGQAGTEADVMMAAFRSFERFKLDHSCRPEYNLPARVYARLHRMPRVIMYFVIFLELVVGAIIIAMISCGKSMDIGQIFSVALFLVTFVAYAISLECSPQWQKSNFRAYVFATELMCDKSVQRALTTEGLRALTESLEMESARV
jgi:hypothetical protein